MLCGVLTVDLKITRRITARVLGAVKQIAMACVVRTAGQTSTIGMGARKRGGAVIQ